MHKGKFIYQVYGDILSGNCYKIKLLMQFLSIKHDWIHVDILQKETHNPEFKKMNGNAKIPVLQVAESSYLCESNAILNFLAESTEFLPSDKFDRAKVLEWQFFEQYSHEPFIAVARYINKYLGLPKERVEEYKSKQEGDHKALSLMDEQLSNSRYFIGEIPTIADISLYAYTRVAHEGGFELQQYPNIQAWFERIEAIPGYIPMAGESA